MKKKSRSFKQVPLPGMGEYFQDDGIDREPDVPLSLSLIGEGASKIAQFTDLLKRMGLSRVHRLCEKHAIYGIRKEKQLLVDTKCGSRKDYYKCEKESGVLYYIYANHDTSTKKDYLSRLSKAMLKEREKTHQAPPVENAPPESETGKPVLAVSFADGTVIAEKTAKDTFAKVIEHIGPARVASIGRRIAHGPLVSQKRNEGQYASSFVEVSGGWFVGTHSSTKEKISHLIQIKQRLGVEMTIAWI